MNEKRVFDLEERLIDFSAFYKAACFSRRKALAVTDCAFRTVGSIELW
jgi:hypothetical protein